MSINLKRPPPITKRRMIWHWSWATNLFDLLKVEHIELVGLYKDIFKCLDDLDDTFRNVTGLINTSISSLASHLANQNTSHTAIQGKQSGPNDDIIEGKKKMNVKEEAAEAKIKKFERKRQAFLNLIASEMTKADSLYLHNILKHILFDEEDRTFNNLVTNELKSRNNELLTSPSKIPKSEVRNFSLDDHSGGTKRKRQREGVNGFCNGVKKAEIVVNRLVNGKEKKDEGDGCEGEV
ncbi:hypothetical protein L6452_20208 [Arctium lappa]|uniref:Uncharacterized protein n=1 Tax=Arctium lappa TaxID=4217 RepID=A0ACB9BC04_ARCLA|nr:hypothetical protein L6452_20208 [Arctium lappa]